MDSNTLNILTSSLKDKFPDVGIKSIDVNESTGQSTFILEPTKKSLAFLDKTGITPRSRESAATITRDYVQRSVLDLAKKDPYSEDYKESFKRAIQYYYTDPMVGSTTNVLAALACKGFENDIDDDNIKNFFDVWAFDVGFEEILESIFLDFFKVGHVTTYKAIASYEPRVSYLSPIPGQKMKTQNTNTKAASLEYAAKKNIWSKGHLPVAYTVLNPLLVNVTGNLLFDKVGIALTPPPELTEILKKSSSDLTEEEQLLIKALPSDLKAAAEKGGEYKLDSRLASQITYRKQPYERYAKPRSTRVFDSLEYKASLRQADLSTLDGITNYILKITIGNDEYPVVSQTELETVAKLFDTPSKSFDVVWNHTLQVEKIVSPEIDKILGKGKYEQVDDDLTVGLSIAKSLLGAPSGLAAAEVELLTKGLMEEINYARRQITRWIYKEYRQIAEAMGFERFPKVRWDEGILIDTILYYNTLGQMVDRRMLSYRTSLEALGFDYENELKNMEEEVPLVEDGTFGVIGSPWQQSATEPADPNDNVSTKPANSPSSGPPKGTVKTPQGTTKTVKQSDVSPNQQKKNKQVKQAASIEDVKTMSALEYSSFLAGAKDVLSEETFAEFLEELSKIRYGN